MCNAQNKKIFANNRENLNVICEYITIKQIEPLISSATAHVARLQIFWQIVLAVASINPSGSAKADSGGICRVYSM